VVVAFSLQFLSLIPDSLRWIPVVVAITLPMSTVGLEGIVASAHLSPRPPLRRSRSPYPVVPMLPAFAALTAGVLLTAGPGLPVAMAEAGSAVVPEPALEPAPVQGLAGTEVHPEARRAASRLFSPHCPGVTLAHCPAEGSVALRDTLDALAHEGMTSGALERRVLDTHGASLATIPPPRGGGLLVWAGVPAILLMGVAGFGLLLRRITPLPSRPVRAA
jgi:cytochrome c-type biogenesis protein CcmH/NrfF